MKKIISILLVLVILMASMPISSVYASYPEPLDVKFGKDVNGFQKVNFETEATAGSGTTFRTIGWRIQYRQNSSDSWRTVRINVIPDEGLKLSYELWLMKLGYETNLGRENTLSDERVQTSIETQVPSGDRDYYLETCKNGGEWKFHAVIQLCINGVPQAGKTADTLDEALSLASWGSNTIDDFYEQYYNRPGISDPEPPEAFNEVDADFNILYKGDRVNNNQGDPSIKDNDDLELILEDDSTVTVESDPITSYKWYYWDIQSGFKELKSGMAGITVNDGGKQIVINNCDANLPGSNSLSKGFRMEASTEAGISDSANHNTYFVNPAPLPPAGKANITVYYRDKDTNLDIANHDTTTYYNVDYGTYTITALVTPPDGCTLDASTPSPQTVTVDSSNDNVEVVFYYNGTTPPPPPAKEPPTAILDTPEEVMAGEPVRADGSDSWSNNPGGYIEDWDFEYEGANLIKDNDSNVRIWYPLTGTYEIYLEVEDENGKHDSIENEIEVTPPIPVAVITISGILKENRKVTIRSIDSTSPEYYPIDITKIVWTITPVSGGTTADIKYNGVLDGNESKDILFKKAGKYKIRLTVYNTYGLSASAEQTITISQDLPPVASLYLPTPEGIEYTIYRDPEDSNYATAEMFNESYSPDGDTINKAVALYCYDTDNDGSYTDEQWYYSKNGTDWVSTGMNYANTVSNFNIYNIATSNVQKFTHKSKGVGRYWYVIRVMEDIPENETISEFINESDYKRDDDF